MTLEERIKRIICASEIELDGEAYIGKYELNNAKSIRNFILDKLRGKIKNLSTGNCIALSKQSAQKLASHLKDGEVYQKSLAHIPLIIEKDGKPHTILSTVGHTKDAIYYDQNVFEGITEEVFAKAERETSNVKYSRLNAILNSKIKAVGNLT